MLRHGRAPEPGGIEEKRYSWNEAASLGKEVVELEYARWETYPVVIDTAGQSLDRSIAALFEVLDLG